MPEIETDCFVVGNGAVGIALVNMMLDASNAHTIVDRHGKPGAYCNDAIPLLHSAKCRYSNVRAIIGRRHSPTFTSSRRAG